MDDLGGQKINVVDEIREQNARLNQNSHEWKKNLTKPFVRNTAIFEGVFLILSFFHGLLWGALQAKYSLATYPVFSLGTAGRGIGTLSLANLGNLGLIIARARRQNIPGFIALVVFIIAGILSAILHFVGYFTLATFPTGVDYNVYCENK